MRGLIFPALSVLGCPLSSSQTLIRAQSLSSPLVFAHYMLITRPPGGDYSQDIDAAIGAGMDAFALNYGGYNLDWSVQEGYLADFYAAAQGKKIKLFLSFDTTSQPNKLKKEMCVDFANRYATNAAQLHVDDRMMISSFQSRDPNWNWKTDVQDHIQAATLMLPGTLSEDATAVFQKYDGAFTWIHPTKTPDQESNTDNAYDAARRSSGKKWMAAIAPWFFKRFDKNQNRSHAQDEHLFISRFQYLLSLKPDFIELVTWNDWGESSYIGPADTTREYPPAYWSDIDQSGFLKVASIFIKAFKAGVSNLDTVDPSVESVFLFYRLQPAATNEADDILPLPLDAEYLQDEAFVATFLASPADVSVTSGGRVTRTSVPAGVTATGVAWSLGAQCVIFKRAYSLHLLARRLEHAFKP